MFPSKTTRQILIFRLKHFLGVVQFVEESFFNFTCIELRTANLVLEVFAQRLKHDFRRGAAQTIVFLNMPRPKPD